MLPENTFYFRECFVNVNINGFKNVRKALFHRWTENGCAIVEFDDGKCGLYDATQIKFAKPVTFDFEE